MEQVIYVKSKIQFEVLVLLLKHYNNQCGINNVVLNNVRQNLSTPAKNEYNKNKVVLVYITPIDIKFSVIPEYNFISLISDNAFTPKKNFYKDLKNGVYEEKCKKLLNQSFIYKKDYLESSRYIEDLNYLLQKKHDFFNELSIHKRKEICNILLEIYNNESISLEARGVCKYLINILTL